MKKTNVKRILSVALSFVLIAVIALTMTGCGKKKEESPQAPAQTHLKFVFKVIHSDGDEVTYNITTDKKYVGEALQEGGFIDGDEEEYGLYVKTVNGETLDYDTDGMYWAFYENDVLAARGADQTEIIPGATYEFRAEA